jgi:hypothetical protein
MRFGFLFLFSRVGRILIYFQGSFFFLSGAFKMTLENQREHCGEEAISCHLPF